MKAREKSRQLKKMMESNENMYGNWMGKWEQWTRVIRCPLVFESWENSYKSYKIIFHMMDTVLSSIIIIHCKVTEKYKNNYRHMRTGPTHSWKCDTTDLQQNRKDVSWWKLSNNPSKEMGPFGKASSCHRKQRESHQSLYSVYCISKAKCDNSQVWQVWSVTAWSSLFQKFHTRQNYQNWSVRALYHLNMKLYLQIVVTLFFTARSFQHCNAQISIANLNGYPWHCS